MVYPLGHKLREETHTGTGKAVGYLFREFGRSDISSMVHQEEAWTPIEFYPWVTWTTDQCRTDQGPIPELSKEQSAEQIMLQAWYWRSVTCLHHENIKSKVRKWGQRLETMGKCHAKNVFVVHGGWSWICWVCGNILWKEMSSLYLWSKLLAVIWRADSSQEAK